MKVVIGANSLSGPLTGIGNYTRNLVESLALYGGIDDLRLLSHGWLSAPITPVFFSEQSQKVNQDQSSEGNLSLLSKLRPMASKNRPLVELYDIITSITANISLRKYDSNDIFHSPDFQFANFPGKTVVTIPDLSTISFPEFHPSSRVAYINRHIRRAIDRADHLVTISDYVKNEINEKLGVPKERITTIYPGVESDFSPISTNDFESSVTTPGVEYKNYFIFVSTIEPRKNLATLLEAYKCYIDTQGTSTIPLVVVGLPGWNSSDIHKELSLLAEHRHVIYLGYVDRDKLRTLIAGARALLFPSLYEGFGLPVIEAMKSGTAVLTSKNSAMSEISKGAALLVSPYDKDDILQNILDLHQDQHLIENMVARGLEVSKAFSWERSAYQTLSLYRALQH
jgi:glycosyltransferase involved in cell wall biosynthesis